jgi:hypothetical protein
MPTRTPSAVTVAAALLFLLTGCSGYDETAHRSAAAEALGVDELDNDTWADIRDLAQETCDGDEKTFAYAAAMSADGDDPERALGLRRVNVEHVCPDRLGELDELIAGFEY